MLEMRSGLPVKDPTDGLDSPVDMLWGAKTCFSMLIPTVFDQNEFFATSCVE